jgi:hypothetical protein
MDIVLLKRRKKYNMGKLNDLLMGKSKVESFEDFEELIKKRIERYKKEGDLNKKKRVERKLRLRIFKFFKGLNRLGIEVYLEGKDGKGLISKEDVLERIDLERIYKVYIIKTIGEIKDEIKKRSK